MWDKFSSFISCCSTFRSIARLIRNPISLQVSSRSMQVCCHPWTISFNEILEKLLKTKQSSVRLCQQSPRLLIQTRRHFESDPTRYQLTHSRDSHVHSDPLVISNELHKSCYQTRLEMVTLRARKLDCSNESEKAFQLERFDCLSFLCFWETFLGNSISNVPLRKRLIADVM